MKYKLHQFFFNELDGRVLGILRIIFFLTVIVVFGGMPLKNLCLLPSGLKTHVTIFNVFNDFFLNPGIMDYLLITWKVSLVFCVIGLLSVLFIPIAFVCTGILFSLHNAYSCGFHGANLFFLGMGILMLSPAGKYISIDNFIAKKHNVYIPSKTPVWPVRLIQINFVLMFFSGAVSKFLNLGLGYVTGDEFYSVILIKKTWGGSLPYLFEYLLDHPLLARFCGAYAFIIELFCPLSFLNVKIMKLIIVSLGVMQLLIYFNMGISSFNAMPAIYAFWFNWEKVIGWYEKNKI
ncbi:MAG: hypothetical protein WC635_06935 [Bacteriovorax sp.]|jgi:hypothetical protein